MAATLTDTQDFSTGTPYNGTLGLIFKVRITDTRNCTPLLPPCSGPFDQDGTATDTDIGPIPLSCSAGTCTTAPGMTMNSWLPGLIEPDRAISLQVFRPRINDPGANGTLGDSDDVLFAQKGLFVP